MKVCPKCERTLPLSAFHRRSSSPDGRQYQCKDCRRAYLLANRAQIKARHRRYIEANPERRGDVPTQHKRSKLQRVYGITLEEYQAMALEQGGVCAICARPETARHHNGTLRSMAVDHDHETGTVRGLLCGRCNRALGIFGDDEQLLRKAAEYLESARAGSRGGR